MTKLDTKKPAIPTLQITNFTCNGSSLNYTIKANTTDSGSGIKKYQYSINNGSTWADINGNQITIGQIRGNNHYIKVRAYDNALNYSDSSIIINLTPTKILVGQLYQQLLGRIPTQGEIDFHATNSNASLVVKNIAISSEGEKYLNTVDKFVKRMYLGILGRGADSGGYNTYVNTCNNYGREQVVKDMTNSPEFINLCNKWGITRYDL